MKQPNKPFGIKFIIGFFMFSFVIWTIGQGGAVVAYDVVSAGDVLQPSRDKVDPVIVEDARAIGLADMFTMMPLFVIAIIGLLREKLFGYVASWLVLGITIYWPIVFLASQYYYKQASIKYFSADMATVALLIIIEIIAIWATIYLYGRWRTLSKQ